MDNLEEEIIPGISPRTMYSREIIIDESRLPKILTDLFREMEKNDQDGNFIMYDAGVEELEPLCKNMLLNHGLSESDYRLIMRKYGGEL